MTVTALDDHTVQFHLPAPFAPFLRSMCTAIYPKHILEPYVAAGAFGQVWDIDTDPTEVIGTGPFAISSYVPGERVVLSRNPNYWLEDDEGNSLPYLDEVVRLIVPDLGAELTKFRAGESDIHGVLGEEFETLEPIQQAEDFIIHELGPGFGTTFLTFNTNPEQNADTGEPYVSSEQLAWFRNVQFRRAVAHVIDKDTIIDEVYHGHGFPQWSSISPATGDFHNPDVRRYEYDIAQANAILDSLGWVDTDGDGIREDNAGNPIRFTMATNDGNTVRQAVGTIIHQGLQAVGIGAGYEIIGFGEIVSQLTSSYDWEAILIGFGGGIDPYGGIVLWHSSEDLHLWYPNQPQPMADWEPKSMSCTSRPARSWTTTSGWNITTAPRKSWPRMCPSSIPCWAKVSSRCATFSETLRLRFMGGLTSDTCTGQTSSAVGAITAWWPMPGWYFRRPWPAPTRRFT